MKSEKEIKDAMKEIQENLTQGMSEVDTARLRTQYGTLGWVLSDEPKRDGFSEDEG